MKKNIFILFLLLIVSILSYFCYKKYRVYKMISRFNIDKPEFKGRLIYQTKDFFGNNIIRFLDLQNFKYSTLLKGESFKLLCANKTRRNFWVSNIINGKKNYILCNLAGSALKKQETVPKIYNNYLKRKSINYEEFVKTYKSGLFYSKKHNHLINLTKDKKVTLIYNPNKFHGYESERIKGKGISNYYISYDKSLVFFDRHYYSYDKKEKKSIYLTNLHGNFVLELFYGSNPIWFE